MRIKFGLVDLLVFVAVFALFNFRNWQAVAFLIVVVAYAAFRYYKTKKGELPHSCSTKVGNGGLPMFAVGDTMYRAAFPNLRSSSSDIFLRRVRKASTSKAAS
jgi:hypothetical protein